jgi:C4-dicarboxylate-specific signal transduction histidine kinase
LNLRVEQRTAELTSANVQLREEILERNRVELALRGSETKIRALLDAIPDLMLRIHRDGTFLDYHAKDDSDLALPTSGLTGQIINKVMPLHVAKPVMDRVRAALRTKQLQVFEYDLQSADRVQGTRIQTHEARIVVSGRDEVLVIIRNVTDRRRAEDQATAHQAQLAHVARLNSMGEMATDLAHELNQPLAAIMNYAEHCVREMQGNPNTPEHWIDGANQVINQAERAGKIIKRIRSFVEKREHEDELLQVNETVQNAIDMAATDARHRQVEIELALEPQMSLVRGDAIQIEQVVLNLVRNAIDAMEEAGVENREIIVTTEVVDGQMIQVQVADTGPGLVQTSIDNVFEPFYTTKPDGLGMGLTISRSIVEAHGGKLSVQNNVLTQGASFEFTLPIHPRGESKVPDVERTDRVRGG